MGYKLEETIREVHRKAAVAYSPAALCKFLYKKGNIYVVDAESAAKDGSAAQFICAMNSIYGWNYSTEYKTTTVYLDYDDNKIIYGGVYDLSTGTCLTRRAIASVNSQTPYIYTERKIDEIINILMK